MRERPPHRWLAAAFSATVLTVSGAGCVGQPVPATDRADFARLKARVSSPHDVRCVVAFRAAEPLEASSARGERACSVVPDATAGAAAVADVVRALGLFREVAAADGGVRTISLRAPADARELRLDVTARCSEVEYVGFSGVWPVSLFVWIFVPGADFWFPDETFAARVEWEARLTDTATGLVLAQRRVQGACERDLNDWDRGVSLWDCLCYGVAPISATTLDGAGRLLLPHAEAEATLALARWLVDEAQPALEAAPVAPAPGPGPGPAPAPTRTRVLCVGVAEYRDDPALPFADADATDIAAALTTALACDAADVTTLVNGDATAAAVRAWLDARAGEALGASDRVWIFFAGRGATDGEGEPYLLPYDARAAAPAQAGIALRAVADALRAAGEVTLCLDCAFQGRGTERGPDTDRAPIPASLLLPARRGFRALAAAYGSGEATARASWRNGVFTEHLLGTLAGGADTDGDGTTTVGEALTHLLAHVGADAQQRGVDETPALLAGDPAGALWPGAKR